MEFYAVIEHEGKYYSWQKHPGDRCMDQCDLYGVCWKEQEDECVMLNYDLNKLCKLLRKTVGGCSTTHRFKEVHLET